MLNSMGTLTTMLSDGMQLLEKYLTPSKQTRPPPCMTETRVDILANAQALIESIPNNETTQIHPYTNLCWLTGIPGSGKSSIASSLVDMASNLDMDLSYFFCKRDDPLLSSAARIFPTLSHVFCEQDESYRRSVLALMRSMDRKVLEKEDLDTQFELLFKKPLESRRTPHQEAMSPAVFIIDALDECSDKDARCNIARKLVSLSNAAPWIKVFVTSRRDAELESIFVNAHCNIVDISMDESSNNRDIRTYARAFLDKWDVSPADMDRLLGQIVERAAGLFIWVSTLFRSLDDHLTRLDDLTTFLATNHVETSDPMEPLYQLYDHIIESSATAKHDKTRIYLILGIIFTSERPLSARSVAKFLGMHLNLTPAVSEAALSEALKRLRAVLCQESGYGGQDVIRAQHPSFLDYLKGRLEAAEDPLQLGDLHFLLATCCLRVMADELNLTSEHRSPYGQDRDELQTRGSPELQYSRQYWFLHLSRCSQPEPLVQDVEGLLCTTSLWSWLACMSPADRLSESMTIVSGCARIYPVRPM